jgi:hypothetical protein
MRRMQSSHNLIGRLLLVLIMTVSLTLFVREVGLASPWSAIVLSFCALGLLDTVGHVISISLPRPLYELRSWERRGDVYRFMRVPAFGTMLRRSPLRLLNRRVYFRGSPRETTGIRRQIEAAEAAHFWAALASIPYLAVATAQGWWSTVICLVLFDLTVNLYPILHLRWVRARMERAFRSNMVSIYKRSD